MMGGVRGDGQRDESPIDAYLAALDAPTRETLQDLRRTILEIVPDAEETLAYGVPGFRRNGKLVAGFAAFKDHVSYLPHSGAVLASLGDDLQGYPASKGALRFTVHTPLPRSLVAALVAARLREIDGDSAREAE
jgi:uncharacterized protein YdhG (YjbR/CyaY superfamily)